MTQPGSGLPKQFGHTLVDVHSSYRAGRQAHQPPDELITDSVTPRALRPHLVRSSSFLTTFLVLSFFVFLCLLMAMVVGILEAFSNAFSGQQSSGASNLFAGFAYFLIVLLLIVVVAWIIALFAPVSEPIAEYGLLVERRAPAAPVCYWWIMNTIRERHSPFNVQFGHAQGVPVMLLSSGRVRGLIVVVPVGADLYLGWTMWRSRSAVVVVGHMIRDIFQGAGIGSVTGDVRDAKNRAMRELIHSVTREGVQAAILRPPVAEEVARAEMERLPQLDLTVVAMPGPPPAGPWRPAGPPQPSAAPASPAPPSEAAPTYPPPPAATPPPSPSEPSQP